MNQLARLYIPRELQVKTIPDAHFGKWDLASISHKDVLNFLRLPTIEIVSKVILWHTEVPRQGE